MSLRVTMLGSGTSTGVPVIGCDCRVCQSSNPRNRRLRCSLCLELGPRVVLIDTSTDLRQQALRYGLERLDAVLFTHAHADHVCGLDDVRPFNFQQDGAIPCYGSTLTLERIRQMFAYAFTPEQEGGGVPQLALHPVAGPFSLFGRQVVPVPLRHGSLEVFGYRLGAFAYLTDCNAIPEPSFELLHGLDVLILDALRYRPHPTHFHIAQALAAAARIGARQTYLTHITHDVDHDAPEVPLPPEVAFGYDGLQFLVP